MSRNTDTLVSLANPALQGLAREKLLARDYEGFLSLFGSHERLRPLLRLIAHARLPSAVYWQLVRSVWVNAEVIQPDAAFWLYLLSSRRGERMAFMTAQELKFLNALPAKLTIFRGFSSPEGERGFSWTLSKRKARWFANYSCGGRRALLAQSAGTLPTVVVATCWKRDVIAYIEERREQEIIILPQNVMPFAGPDPFKNRRIFQKSQLA